METTTEATTKQYGLVSLVKFPDSEDPRVLGMSAFEGTEDDFASRMDDAFDALLADAGADEDYWVERPSAGSPKGVVSNDDVVWWLFGRELDGDGQTGV